MGALSDNRLIEALDFFNCVLDGRVRQGAGDSEVIAQAAGFDRPFINSHPFKELLQRFGRCGNVVVVTP